MFHFPCHLDLIHSHIDLSVCLYISSYDYRKKRQLKRLSEVTSGIDLKRLSAFLHPVSFEAHDTEMEVTNPTIAIERPCTPSDSQTEPAIQPNTRSSIVSLTVDITSFSTSNLPISDRNKIITPDRSMETFLEYETCPSISTRTSIDAWSNNKNDSWLSNHSLYSDDVTVDDFITLENEEDLIDERPLAASEIFNEDYSVPVSAISSRRDSDSETDNPNLVSTWQDTSVTKPDIESQAIMMSIDNTESKIQLNDVQTDHPKEVAVDYLSGDLKYHGTSRDLRNIQCNQCEDKVDENSLPMDEQDERISDVEHDEEKLERIDIDPVVSSKILGVDDKESILDRDKFETGDKLDLSHSSDNHTTQRTKSFHPESNILKSDIWSYDEETKQNWASAAFNDSKKFLDQQLNKHMITEHCCLPTKSQFQPTESLLQSLGHVQTTDISPNYSTEYSPYETPLVLGKLQAQSRSVNNDLFEWARGCDSLANKSAPKPKWIHGHHVTRVEAERIIRALGQQDGLFLVRQRFVPEACIFKTGNERQVCCFTHAITLVANGNTEHHRILKMDDQSGYICNLGNSPQFVCEGKDLNDLVRKLATQQCKPLRLAITIPSILPEGIPHTPPFFHGYLTRNEAVERLSVAGASEGQYLIRLSRTVQDQLSQSQIAVVLSVVSDGAVRHHVLHFNSFGWTLNNQFVFDNCSSITEVVSMLMLPLPGVNFVLSSFVPATPPLNLEDVFTFRDRSIAQNIDDDHKKTPHVYEDVY